MPSGYGKQARHAGKILRELGHEVAFSCFSGLSGQPIRWDGYTLFPYGAVQFGLDTLVPHALTYGADLVITLMDTFKLEPAAAQIRQVADDPGIAFAHFVITDCLAENGGPSVPDQRVLARTGGYPVAVSRFGWERLEAIGYDAKSASCVPHCVDTSVYVPLPDRQALREELGTPGDFVIGIMAANKDFARKGFQEQFAAFQRFSRKHPDARLALFTVPDGPGGHNLPEMASDMGIAERCVFMPAYEQIAGMLPEEFMAKWYNSVDVLSLCSYGEGFGVPLVEAQACGTPVVATDFSAMTELARPAGWLVKGERYWNPVHRAWWSRPREDEIVRAWERAYASAGDDSRRQKARQFAEGYSVEQVARQFWEPFMSEMKERL